MAQQSNYAYPYPAPYAYHPYPQQMGYTMPPQPQTMYPAPPVRAQPEPIYNQALSYSFECNGQNRAIVLKNVELPHKVNVESSTLNFERGEPNNGKLKFSFSPDGEEHTVSVKNYGRSVYDFKLKPRAAEVEFERDGGKSFLVNNLYNPKNLKLASDRKIDWSLTKNDLKENSYRLNFAPHGKVQKIKLTTVNRNGQKTAVKNGEFKIAPKNEESERSVQNHHRLRQAPVYAAPQYGYPPPPYYAQPVPNMYSAPPQGYYPPQPYYQPMPPMSQNQGPPRQKVREESRRITSRVSQPRRIGA